MQRRHGRRSGTYVGNREVVPAPDTQAEEATHEAYEGSGEAGPPLYADLDLIEIMPVVSLAELNRLAVSIMKGDCEPAVTVWREESIILGGLWSLIVARKEGFDCRIEEISLPDWEAAKAWSIRDQLRRTDLTHWERAQLGLHLLPLVEAETKKPAPAGENTRHDRSRGDIDVLRMVASECQVPETTLCQAAFIVQNAQAAYLDLLNDGEISIDGAYKTMQRVERGHATVGGREYGLVSPHRARSLAILQNECQAFLKHLTDFSSRYRARRVPLDPAHRKELRARLQCAKDEIEAFLDVLNDDDDQVVNAMPRES